MTKLLAVLWVMASLTYAQIPADSSGATHRDSSSAVAASPQLVSVKVLSAPDSAEVLLDSVSVGLTPVAKDSVTTGRHSLIIKKEGHFLKKATVMVRGDTVNEFSFVLLKPVRLAITSIPPGATVSLDKKNVGVTPYDNRKTRPGSYALEIALAGYQPVQKQIMVSDTASDSLHFDLVKISTSNASNGSVAAKPAPAKAKVDPAQERKDTTMRIVVAAAFAVFGLGILLAELIGQ